MNAMNAMDFDDLNNVFKYAANFDTPTMRFQKIYCMVTNLNGIGFQKYVCQILKKE